MLASVPLWLAADRFPQLAGAFPKAIVGAIVVLAVLLLGRTLVGPRLQGGDGSSEARAMSVPLLVAATSILAVIGMRFVGYFPSMIALGIALFFPLAGERRALYLVAVASALVFVFVVFVILLGVPLGTSLLFGR